MNSPQKNHPDTNNAPRRPKRHAGKVLAFRPPFKRRSTPSYRLSLRSLPPTYSIDQRRTLIEKMKEIERLKGIAGLRVVEVIVDRLLYNHARRQG
jgi:hypothetical protein